MQCDNSKKSFEEWPTLDVVNSMNSTDGRVGTAEINGASINGKSSKNGKSKTTETKTGGKKRNFSKKSSVKLPIETPSYRNGRYSSSHNYAKSNEFDRSQESNRYQNGENHSNGCENGRGNFRSRGYRGNRFRGSNQHHRAYRVSTEKADEKTSEASGSCTYFDPVDQKYDAQAALKNQIRTQIEYYFSEENLIKDMYLRQKMDTFGFVPLTLIANFGQILKITNDLSLIVESVKESSRLDLALDYYIRPVVNPQRWPIIHGVIRHEVPQFTSNDDLIHHMSNLSINNGFPQQMCQNSVYIPYPPPNFISPPVPAAFQDTNSVPLPATYQTTIHVPIQSSFQDSNGTDLQQLGACALPKSDSNLYCENGPSTSSALPSESDSAVYYDNGPSTSGAVPTKTDSLVYYSEGPSTSNDCSRPSSPAEVNYYDSLPQVNSVIYLCNSHQSNGYGTYSIPREVESLSGEDKHIELQSPEPSR